MQILEFSVVMNYWERGQKILVEAKKLFHSKIFTFSFRLNPEIDSHEIF